MSQNAKIVALAVIVVVCLGVIVLQVVVHGSHVPTAPPGTVTDKSVIVDPVASQEPPPEGAPQAGGKP